MREISARTADNISCFSLCALSLGSKATAGASESENSGTLEALEICARNLACHPIHDSDGKVRGPRSSWIHVLWATGVICLFFFISRHAMFDMYV